MCEIYWYFCRPSCKSKIPKRENIIFIDTKEEAIEAGYRPCKRCRNDLISYKPLKEVAIEIKKLSDNYWNDSINWKQELRALGFSQHRLDEIFKEEYNMTPTEYMTTKKLEYAKEMLLETDMKIIDIAYDLGFNQLSSFYKFFKNNVGMAPANYRKCHKNM
ncbi:MAG: helix-turn-helix domain-containing protein [Erysipelotrichaceae bacterium]|nr:helix-turn-helix domain-containing protein [Erysipelotrichaceae bacterium]